MNIKSNEVTIRHLDAMMEEGLSVLTIRTMCAIIRNSEGGSYSKGLSFLWNHVNASQQAVSNSLRRLVESGWIDVQRRGQENAVIRIVKEMAE
jgi:DNA-binding MarR family transcriptional regulator